MQVSVFQKSGSTSASNCFCMKGFELYSQSLRSLNKFGQLYFSIHLKQSCNRNTCLKMLDMDFFFLNEQMIKDCTTSDSAAVLCYCHPGGCAQMKGIPLFYCIWTWLMLWMTKTLDKMNGWMNLAVILIVFTNKLITWIGLQPLIVVDETLSYWSNCENKLHALVLCLKSKEIKPSYRF